VAAIREECTEGYEPPDVSIGVLSLVLAAAFAHAGWNFLAKGAEGGAAFVWLAALIGTLIYLPVVVIVHASTTGQFRPEALGLMAGSGVLHSIYFVLLQRGYATAGSDTGHAPDDLKFGVGHPDKIDDWAYRAVHVMTENAKLIIRNYYGRLPQYSYFTGCSTGGQQALTEAQRFPADYHGIVAGDPGHNRIHLMAGAMWTLAAASPLTAAKLPLITKAAISSCSAP